jgi:hypothetical protein
MSSVTLSSLPDPILHLICVYLTPDRPTVNDEENGQSPALYRPIINLSLTAHALNRISSTHIATNISLTDGCTRWDLFLRTVTNNPTYAFNVKYLKFSECTEEERRTNRPTRYRARDYDDIYYNGDEVYEMLKALCGLEVLYSHHGIMNHPVSIMYRIQQKEIPLWKTLEVVRFDQVNEWDEDRIIQIHFVRENGKVKGNWPLSPPEPGITRSTGNELLTGELKSLNGHSLADLPGVDHVEVTTRDYSDDGDDEEDGDWVDDEESDGWSERDYEYDSEESSDWDSEDDSDYEDDWEAEYGFAPSPKVEPVKDLPVRSAATAPPIRGPSLLDF